MIKIIGLCTLIFWSFLGFSQIRMPVKPLVRASDQVVASTSQNEGLWVLLQNESDSHVHWVLRHWNGTFWQNKAEIRTHPNAVVHSMKFDHNQKLHLVGNFEVSIQGQEYRNLIYWDRTQWGSYREAGYFKPSDTLYSIENHNQKTYIGGSFDSLNGQYMGNWAVWDGTQWAPIRHQGGHGGLSSRVLILQSTSRGLFVSGDFESPTIPGSFPGLVLFSDSAFTETGLTFNKVFAISNTYPTFVAGTNISNQTQIMRWEDHVWTRADQGIRSLDTFWQLIAYEQLILAVGNASDSSGTDQGTLMAWNGSRWQRVNLGMEVARLNTDRSILYFINYTAPIWQNESEKTLIGSFQKGQKILRGNIQVNPHGTCNADSNGFPLPRVRVDLGHNRVSQATNDSGYFALYYTDTLPFKLALQQFNPNFEYSLCVLDSSVLENVADQPQNPLEIRVLPQIQTRAELKRNFALQRGGRVAPGSRNALLYTIQNAGLLEASQTQLTLMGSNKLKNFQSNLPFTLSQDSLIVWDLQTIQRLDQVRIWLRFEVHDNLDIEHNSIDLGLTLSYYNGLETVQEEDRFSQSILTDSLLSSKEQFINQELRPHHTVISEKDTLITYQIHFSAPPNQTLNHVVVIDTVRLHERLLFTQELLASHEYETRLEPLANDPNRALLIWTFQDFPEHSGENAFLNQNGFIRFLFAYAPLKHGDSLHNSAFTLINGNQSTSTNSVICRVDKNSNVSDPFMSKPIPATLYPNPCQNSVFISISEPHSEHIPYFIRDIQGKWIGEGHFSKKNSIDVSSLLSGTYYITYKHNHVFFTIPFIKL